MSFLAGLLHLVLLVSVGRTHASNSGPPTSGFKLARPGYVYNFPRDHGVHPEFQTEWWYYTGHLRTAKGKQFGFELTFFRTGVKPPAAPGGSTWKLEHLGLAHFALTDISAGKFRYYEKLNRWSPFTASAASSDVNVFNEGWSATTLPDGRVRLLARAAKDSIDLVLHSRKPPAIHGTNGISVKALGEGFASHYYSLTRLVVEGTVTSGGKPEQCRGLAWMDHEFGSAALREHQAGWDWFSIQLDDDTELMLYVIRTRDGRPDLPSSGSFIRSDGSVLHLTRDDFAVMSTGTWKSPKSGATYPMGWRISVPKLGLSLAVKEEMEEQELITTGSTQVTYWEGAVRVNGSSSGKNVAGRGYVELTGYDRPFRAARAAP